MDKLRALFFEWKNKNLASHPSHYYPRKIRGLFGRTKVAWVPLEKKSGEVARRQRRLRKGKLSTVRRLEVLISCLRWTRSEYFSEHSVCLESVSGYLIKVSRIWYARGTLQAIAWARRVREIFIQWLATGSLKKGSRSHRKAWRLFASGLGSRNSRKSPSPEKVRWMLTVLTLLRGERLGIPIDVTSVIQEGSGNTRLLEIYGGRTRDFWAVVKSRLGACHPRREVSWRRFHLTTKRGPGGGHALLWALGDYFSLPKELKESLLFVGGKKFRETADFLDRNAKFCEFIQRRLSSLDFDRAWGDVAWGSSPIRRLAGIPDKWGKTRAVAILDYMSQTVLRPLHDFIFRVLKSIPQDYTFNQGGFKDRIKWGEGIVYHSVDLSKATDRFPFLLTLAVVEPIFGRDWVNHLRRILVGYPFLVPKGATGEVGPEGVFYRVGSPMGALGSFALFAFGHHYLVFWCCVELGIPWEDAEYALLGDDIAFWNPVLAERYKELLLDLGVEVSPSKTIVSDSLIEFASRFIYKGVEVTPFPISSVSDRLGEMGLLIAAAAGERKKGFIPRSGIPVAVVRLMLLTNRIKAESASGLVGLADRILLASEFLQGTRDAVSMVLGVAGLKFDDPVRESWPEDRCKALILGGMAETYVSSIQKGQMEDIKTILRMVQADHNCGPTLWPRFVAAVPFFSVLRDGEMGMVRAEEDIHSIHAGGPEAREIFRALGSPLKRESLGLTDEARVYKVSERLGGVIHKIFWGGKYPKKESHPVRRKMDWMFPTKGHILLSAGTRWSR